MDSPMVQELVGWADMKWWAEKLGLQEGSLRTPVGVGRFGRLSRGLAERDADVEDLTLVQHLIAPVGLLLEEEKEEEEEE